MFFSDQTTFTINGIVTFQNTRIWFADNPRWVINCRRQYSQKENVWCGIVNEHILEPYLFEEWFLICCKINFQNEIENLPYRIQ